MEIINHALPSDNDSLVIQKNTNNIINKGTGAGGANTNKNGLLYEEKTNLEPLYATSIFDKETNTYIVTFNGSESKYVRANKANLYKYMKYRGEVNNTLQQAAGCKQPDEAYIDNDRKIVFIIEKKFQQGSGSVDEKIQTGPFKQLHYSQQFPNYTIHYIYCLSEWFKNKEYTSVLEYLHQHNIPVFWGNEDEYKQKIIEYMTNSS
uniref:Uncharacterized protein n=1 Tax=viral metagenome TaxID=1070528 RepID=A0A6C0DEM2_9ZZZZ